MVKRAEVSRYVITGGPGSGKSAIIKHLRSLGYNCFDEYARDFIDKELKRGGDKVPWLDSEGFDNEVLKGRMKQWKRGIKGVNFYDRGVVDSMAYLKNAGLGIPHKFIEAGKKYTYKRVFFLPPWRRIYTQDDERKESFREAKKIGKLIKEVYKKMGYDVVKVPNGGVKERCNLILEKCGEK